VKRRKSSLEIADVPAEIRTEYLLNTSPKRNRYAYYFVVNIGIEDEH
jgi:hypothetical protein